MIYLRHLVFGKASISAAEAPLRKRTALMVLQLAQRTCSPGILPNALIRSYMFVPADDPLAPQPNSLRCAAPSSLMWSSVSASGSVLNPHSAQAINPSECSASASILRLKRYADLARLYCSRFFSLHARFSAARSVKNASPFLARCVAWYSRCFSGVGFANVLSFPNARQG